VPTCKKLLPILRNEIKFLVESLICRKKKAWKVQISNEINIVPKTVSNTLTRHYELKIQFLAANEEVAVRR
jgi:hypothetical protein